MRVYLAAPYVMKDEIKARAEGLRLYGIETTSSWLDEPHKPTTQMGELTHEQHQVYALADVRDVVAADLLIFQTDETKSIIRAGRHVEFGIALALGLTRYYPILVVGETRENIFHHMPQVRHFPDWESVQNELVDMHLSDVF